MVSFAGTPKLAYAGAWGESIYAALLQYVLENMDKALNGIWQGVLKQVSIGQIQNMVMNAIGNNTKPLIISDWRSFIIDQAKMEASVYTIDFLTTTAQAKNEAANYVTAAISSQVQAGGSYVSNLISGALGTIPTVGGVAPLKITIGDYTAHPSIGFAEGCWKCFNAVLQPGNNVFSTSLMAQATMQQKYEESKVALQAEGVASKGFQSVKSNGQIVTPGAVFENLIGSVMDIGNKAIAAAANPYELIGGAVGSVVNKSINNLIQVGVGKVKSKIQREVNNVNQKLYSAQQQYERALGPGAKYDTYVKQNTTARPSVQPSVKPTYGTSEGE